MCRRWTSLPLLVAQVLELADLEPPVPGADGAVDHEAFAGKILSSFVINVKSSSVSTGNPVSSYCFYLLLLNAVSLLVF